MAEYIDRQDLIKFLDNIQQPKMPITEGFKFITIDGAIKVVSERPTADVIERSKIDKAIEKIDFLRQHRAKYITEDSKICIDSGEVLKILKEI